MKERAKWWKAHWRDLVTLVLWGPLWLFAGYDFMTRLNAMNLIRGLTAGTIFFVAPAIVWKTINRLRTETN